MSRESCCTYLNTQDTTLLKESASKQKVLQLSSEEFIEVYDIASIHVNSMEDEGGLNVSRVLLVLLNNYIIATYIT